MVMVSSRQIHKKQRPFVIPIFLPHAGCPHRCVFCNQKSITGIKEKSISTQKLKSRVKAFLKYNGQRRSPVEVAFFGGNFLGQKTDTVKDLLMEATKFVSRGEADGIRFSTRPDTVDRQRLELIENYPISTVELGVQSMQDSVLAAARRGHTATDTVNAIKLLKKYHYRIGLQTMVGLPGDDKYKSFETGRQIVDLEPDFVRIYPTVILKDSALFRWYQSGTYLPLTLGDAVDQVKDLFLLFRNSGIKVIRMGLQASEDFDDNTFIAAGPYHPAFGHLVYSKIFLTAFKCAMNEFTTGGKQVLIQVARENISKMRGLKNENVEIIKKEYGFEAVQVRSNPGLSPEDIKINRNPIYSIANSFSSLMNAGGNSR